MSAGAVLKGKKANLTLKDRVEQALETAGVPRAGEGQRGWVAETARGTVRVYWGYGEPVLKSAQAQSSLGQCFHLLTDAGFTMPEKMFKDREGYIEVLG